MFPVLIVDVATLCTE